MRYGAFVLLLVICIYLSMREASLFFPELTTMLPLTSPEGIIEQVMNFTAILLSAAGVIVACISKSKPKQQKDKVEQNSKSNVKHKKTVPKRSRKVKTRPSNPFKRFFGDSKEKTK